MLLKLTWLFPYYFARRIISDKYWVSCNSSGKVEVWNLRAALDPTHMDSLLLYRLTATDLNFPLICPVVRADEYQIALIPCRAKDYSGLHILDFLQLDHKDVDDTGFISDQWQRLLFTLQVIRYLIPLTAFFVIYYNCDF